MVMPKPLDHAPVQAGSISTRPLPPLAGRFTIANRQDSDALPRNYTESVYQRSDRVCLTHC